MKINKWERRGYLKFLINVKRITLNNRNSIIVKVLNMINWTGLLDVLAFVALWLVPVFLYFLAPFPSSAPISKLINIYFTMLGSESNVHFIEFHFIICFVMMLIIRIFIFAQSIIKKSSNQSLKGSA